MTVDPVLSLVAVLLLAAIFATAAFSKLREPPVFAGVVEQYGLLPHGLVRPFAHALPILELAAALGLLLPATRAPAAVVLILLLLVFAAAMALNLARGRSDIDCGCFIGLLRQRISWALVARNLVLAGFGLALLSGNSGRPLVPLDWFTVVAGSGCLLALYGATGRLFGLAPPAARQSG
jgi:uncharacterized membrane protein YphA (DoxX/SURF4 family)